MRIGIRITVGHIVPATLLLFMLTDAALRLVQGTTGIFSTGPGLRRSKIPGAAFEPNLRVQASVTYGDLARIANVKDSDEIRSSTFATDAMGFRNAEASGRAAGILFGDSFSIAGDDPRETLSAQLGENIGCRVYNAASPDEEFRTPDLSLVRSMAKRVGVTQGFVIIEQVERRAVENRTPRERRVRSKLGRAFSDFWRQAVSLTRDSPLKRLAEDTMRAIRDDRILPNNYLDNVVAAKLTNGDRILFLPAELKTYGITRVPALDYWFKLNRELAQLQLKLLVVLVPNKHTVYRHLLQGAQKASAQYPNLLGRLEAALRDGGVSAIDLTPALRRAADAGYPRRRYIYWRNDTHWNAAGVRVAAQEIVRTFPELKQACPG